MFGLTPLEIFGYVGSVLVAISLMMKNIWYLRWVNFWGAGAFALYGLLVGAYPVFVLNAFISVIDMYYIIQMRSKKDFFSLEPVPEGNSFLIQKFLDFYGEDIRKHVPQFKTESVETGSKVFILRNLVPVGLFIYTPKPNGSLEIELDYVIPDYRDLKNASFLFNEQRLAFKSQGFHSFVTRSTVEVHQSYLQKIGFVPDPADPTIYYKPI
ncbi:MAG: hypothetical protein J0L62_16590 [Bacteroidetes bacterium]|nr:hypothetical protein [Bacteroidota bacterium]